MAIDTERKRKSIASIGHRHTGPVVVPDGSFVQGDRQTIGYSYYGISAAAPGGGATAILKLIDNLPLTALVDNGLIG